MACEPRAPKFHLIIIFAHGISFLLTVIAWWWYYKKNRNLYGDGWVDGHMAVQIIGGVAMFGSSPAMYWPYVYGAQMPPSRRRDLAALFLIVSFLFHDFPCWCLEFWMTWEFGMQDVLQGLSLVVLSIVTAWGFFTTWLYYAYTMARILQKQFGSTMRDLYPTNGARFATASNSAARRRAIAGPPERI